MPLDGLKKSGQRVASYPGVAYLLGDSNHVFVFA